ncbi:MAG: bacteriocin [bacterium]|nr:bacteriocin [bacterium]
MNNLSYEELSNVYGGAMIINPTYDLFMKIYKYFTKWFIKKWF